MANTHEPQFETDLPNKTITVTRHFDAAPDAVWRAWTERDLLDQWWAPRPWTTDTKAFEFTEGGHWLYAMVGPEGERHWNIVEFTHIEPQQRFDTDSAFCDSNGTKTEAMPKMAWSNRFEANGDGTKVTCTLRFESEEALNQTLQMGFRDGFATGLNSLEALLRAGVA